MSTQIKFIPCSEDVQVYHYQRTTKKATHRDLNVQTLSGISLKNKDQKPRKGMPEKKSAPGTFKKLKGNQKKGKK